MDAPAADNGDNRPLSPATQSHHDHQLATLLSMGLDMDAALTALAATGSRKPTATDALTLIQDQHTALETQSHLATAEVNGSITQHQHQQQENARPYLKSILKAPAGPPIDPAALLQQQQQQAASPLSTAMLSATSSLTNRTSAWLKRTLDVDVPQLASQLRTLMAPLAPVGGASHHALLATLPPGFDERMATGTDVPKAWLDAARDADARVPPGPGTVFAEIDAWAARREAARHARHSARRSHRKRPANLVVTDSAPLLPPREGVVSANGTATTAAVTGADPISPTSTDGGGEQPLFDTGRTAAGAGESNDSDDSEPESDLDEFERVFPLLDPEDEDEVSELHSRGGSDLALSHLTPSRRASAQAKRVRFILPRGSAGATSPGSSPVLSSAPLPVGGASSASSSGAAPLAADDFSDAAATGTGSDGSDAEPEMVIVAPAPAANAKHLYSPKEIVQAYMAACTMRRTRPLKAVMDTFVPHLQPPPPPPRAGPAGPNFSPAPPPPPPFATSSPTTLVVEHMHLSAADLVALGAVLDGEWGMLDLRLVNVSLTNDVARYLLAVLARVDSCPSISLAENPDLARPVAVPGSLTAYLNAAPAPPPLPPTSTSFVGGEAAGPETERATAAAAAVSPTPASSAAGRVAAVMESVVRKRGSIASLSGLFASAMGAAAAPAASDSAPTAPVSGPTSPEAGAPPTTTPLPPQQPPAVPSRRTSLLGGFTMPTLSLPVGMATALAASTTTTQQPSQQQQQPPATPAARTKTLADMPFPAILPPFATTVAAYVRHSSALRSLDLSGIPLATGVPGASGVAAINTLAAALAIGPDGLGATLQVLHLDRCMLTTPALAALAPGIARANLSSISLRGNVIDPMGAAEIAKMFLPTADTDDHEPRGFNNQRASMMSIGSLSGSAFTSSRGHDPLWRDVVMGKRPRGVVVVDLSDNLIKSGVKAIGEALAKCAHVKHLMMANNMIQGGHFASFCHAMLSNTSLELLDVSLNDMSGDKRDIEAMHALAAWLSHRPHQAAADREAAAAAADQPAQGVDDIPMRTPKPSLRASGKRSSFTGPDADACPVRSLSLAKSGLTNTALIALSNGLVGNVTLERLNVAANDVQVGAVMAVAHSVLAHPHIVRVELGVSTVVAAASGATSDSANATVLPHDATEYLVQLATTCRRNAERAQRESVLAGMRDALARAWAAARSLASLSGVVLDADGHVVPKHASASALDDMPALARSGRDSTASSAGGEAASSSSSAARAPSPPRPLVSTEKRRALLDKCLEFRATLNEYIMGQDECDPKFMDQVLHWNDAFAELIACS